MAFDCIRYRQFPRPGGWHEQEDDEMAAMRIAERAHTIFTKDKWNAEDRDFIAWVGDE